MKIRFFQRLNKQLFLKIALVFLSSLFIVFISSITIHKFFFLPKKFPVLMRNMVNHAQYMVNEIGIPPDIKKAEELSKKMHLNIRIESPEKKWASHSDMIDFPGLKLPVYEEIKGVRMGFNKEGLCVSFSNKDYRILIIMHSRKEGFRHVVSLLIMIVVGFSSLSLIGVYLVIRWLLKPVKILKEGVEQLGKGNIEYKIETNRSDELGALVDSFNQMAGKVKDMIETRDQLLCNVSHELRSPLTRMRVALEFIEDNDKKRAIEGDISEIEIMIAELLETHRLNSRFGKLKLENTNMINLIREVSLDFKKQKPGIKILSPSNNFFLKIDRRRIKALLRNILNNGLRYSKPDSGPLEISLHEEKNEFIVKIADSGIGIPDKDIPFIFEPFYRVDKSRSRETGGYGLGMSLSKNIMEAHGGSIGIKSIPGKGTTIFLKFKK